MKNLSLDHTSPTPVDIQPHSLTGEIRKHCLDCSNSPKVSHMSYHLRLRRFRRSSFHMTTPEASGATSSTYNCRIGRSQRHKRLHQFRTCRRNCNSRPRFQRKCDRHTDHHRCHRCCTSGRPGTHLHSRFQVRSHLLNYHTSKFANCNIGSRYRDTWHCRFLGRTTHLYFSKAQ